MQDLNPHEEAFDEIFFLKIFEVRYINDLISASYHIVKCKKFCASHEDSSID